MASDAFLIVAEDFYSVQGEGASVGTPAVFLRLAGCNMKCAGFSYRHPETGVHLGCDTAHVWKTGKKETPDRILMRWASAGYLEKLQQGAHLIITGGEPLVQQLALKNFLEALDALLPHPVYIEMETNATFLVDPVLLRRINQINASPKLAHSGESKERRYVMDVLQQLAEQSHVLFKFVVSTPQDVDEVEELYRLPLGIPHERIWLMPEGGTRSVIQARQRWVVECCKERMFNYSSRLHIDIWDEATGV